MYKKIRQYIAVVVITLLSPFVIAAQLVNINTADAITIAENLNGIGASKAKAIIEYRKLHGDFRSVDDLVKVKGIGFKLVERNSSLISFGENDSVSSGLTDSTSAATTDNIPVSSGSEASSGALPPSN